jgi:TolB protein
MKKKFTVHSSQFTVFLLFCLFTVHCLLFTVSHAKVYIDITAPAFRKLPISISAQGQEKAGEIAGIVENDLDFTGIFYPMDPDVPGSEIRVSIEADIGEGITANTRVFDVVENKEVLNKRYTAPPEILRALAHSISNDIFKVVTGKKGIFRTKLSFIGSPSGKKQLYLTDWDGYNPVKVVAKGLSLSHSWSPDGLSIIYSSERKRTWGIYLLDLKSYRERTLFTSTGLNLVGGVSPERLLAFSSSKEGNPEIYVMNIKGSGLKRVTKSFGIDVSPVFSPDGSQIAFVSDRGGSPQVYVMNSSGRRLRRLTFQGSYNTSPEWSPDGKWIAYVGRKNGKNQIFMIKSDSADIRQLTYDGNNENPSFSPDGLFLAFDSDRDGTKGVYLMSMNGEKQRRITSKAMKAMNPEWSPYFR